MPDFVKPNPVKLILLAVLMSTTAMASAHADITVGVITAHIRTGVVDWHSLFARHQGRRKLYQRSGRAEVQDHHAR